MEFILDQTPQTKAEDQNEINPREDGERGDVSPEWRQISLCNSFSLRRYWWQFWVPKIQQFRFTAYVKGTIQLSMAQIEIGSKLTQEEKPHDPI